MTGRLSTGGRRRAPLSGEHESLLAEFLAEESTWRRPAGIKWLETGVPWFLRFMEEQGKLATDVTLADAYAYQGMFIDKHTNAGIPYARATIFGVMAVASTFCDWLARAGKLLENPFSGVRRVRVEKKIPDGILKEREMSALLDSLRQWFDLNSLWQVKRRYLTHVVAELQYASGLRIAEAAALTPDDVDIERALIHVREGKHGSNRIGFLTDYAACVLECYLTRARPLLGNRMRHGDGSRLFFIETHALAKIVNAELEHACVRTGVPVITSHGFRHALGYHLLRAGCPLRYIQTILGHRILRTTEVYTKVDVSDMKAVFDTCHPRMH